MKRIQCPNGMVLEVEDIVAEGLLVMAGFSLAEDPPAPAEPKKAAKKAARSSAKSE